MISSLQYCCLAFTMLLLLGHILIFLFIIVHCFFDKMLLQNQKLLKVTQRMLCQLPIRNSPSLTAQGTTGHFQLPFQVSLLLWAVFAGAYYLHGTPSMSSKWRIFNALYSTVVAWLSQDTPDILPLLSATCKKKAREQMWFFQESSLIAFMNV